MIVLRRPSLPRRLIEQMRRFVSPAYRRRRDAELSLAMRYLVTHPEAACQIDDDFIPDGYGEFDLGPGESRLGPVAAVRREPEEKP